MIIKLTILLAIFHAALSVHLNCIFRLEPYLTVGKQYSCVVEHGMKILSKSDRPVTGFSGSVSNITDVHGFYAMKPHARHFPSNLKQMFPNISAVCIKRSQIREIKMNDLRPFGHDLKYFHIAESELETIEPDLFKYNPNLEFVGFENNNINYIEGYVFDNLRNLKLLLLEGNSCVSYANNNSISLMIQHVKGACYANYLELKIAEKLEDEKLQDEKAKKLEDLF